MLFNLYIKICRAQWVRYINFCTRWIAIVIAYVITQNVMNSIQFFWHEKFKVILYCGMY